MITAGTGACKGAGALQFEGTGAEEEISDKRDEAIDHAGSFRDRRKPSPISDSGDATLCDCISNSFGHDYGPSVALSSSVGG